MVLRAFEHNGLCLQRIDFPQLLGAQLPGVAELALLDEARVRALHLLHELAVLLAHL